MHNNTIQHHGIKGQKWGVRRFQNADGSLTSVGKKGIKNTSENFVKEIRDYKRVYKGKTSSNLTEEIHSTSTKGKNVATKVLDKVKDKVASEYIKRNKANKEKIKQEIMDQIFPRMGKQPWDEKPKKKPGGNI